MRGRRPVRAAGLGEARRLPGSPPGFLLSFRNTTGNATVEGRECIVAVTAVELAAVLGELPASTMTSEQDAVALHRVGRMLRDWAA